MLITDTTLNIHHNIIHNQFSAVAFQPTLGGQLYILLTFAISDELRADL